MQSDSVFIFKTSENCKIIRYGYAKNDETVLILFKINLIFLLALKPILLDQL